MRATLTDIGPRLQRRMRRLAAAALALAALSAPLAADGQIVVEGAERSGPTVIDTDSVRRAFDHGPYFGLYKDNYFIFGTAVGPKPTKQNTNVKFQISISQRLTKSVLPWHTYIYIYYTQKVFWNVLEKSMPMTDLNFNPGIGWTKPLFSYNRYVGKVSLILEHESNGRDGLASRSWNKVSVAASVLIDPQLMVHGKVWIPIVDGENNRDITNYMGVFQTGISYTTLNRKFGASLVLVKRKGFNFNFNTIAELNYRLFKRDNQYLFLQYYNGFGEGMLDYKQFHSELRLGIVIKPTLFSEW